MKLARCTRCALPVLELEGQFSKLDSLYIRGGAPPRETAGWWHARCLADSDAAPLWCEARLANFRDVRRYQDVAVLAQWTVVREPNTGKLLAFGRQGELLSLSRGNRKHARAVAGGSVFPRVEDTFHLELDDEDLVQRIKDGLASSGSVPLLHVIDGLGIPDRTAHPQALERGVFKLDKGLQSYWARRSVSARVEYGVFVPSELEPYIGEFVR